ncbi:MAG TPA: NAD(P)H-quinone oxidoreductase [Candidatus Acidoferrales bacterium]|nr:NAD(P)H-quinone oxidoreductase [Candidatus Acidoferrales bacterium]
MKYVAFDQPGDASVLHVAETAAPAPGPGEVLIEVEAAGVSRADTLQRRGVYPPPKGASPILGLDASGTIARVGADVAGWKTGDRVVALCNGGGYAEYVSVPAGQVLPLPPEWSFVEGATLPENGFTVYDNLIVRARLRGGETALVHGGTSGIGVTAIMFARGVGARVITTAGSEQKCLATLEFGAEAAINYKTADFVEKVQEFTQKRGADVVLDIVGGDYINRDLRCIAGDGRIACIADPAGSQVTIDMRYLFQRRATILGSSLRPRTDEQKAAIARGLRAEVWPLLPARDPIFPVVDSVYAFSQAAQAHERLESSEHIGKIVLVPDP